VDAGTIRFVEVPFPNMGDQLKASNVDAVEALEPFTGALLAAGNLSLGDPLMAAGDEVLFPFWISDGAWARANRPIIKAWIDALTEAKTYMDANPAETRAILAKYSRLPPAVVEKVPLPTYRFTIKPAELEVWINVLKELGHLTVPVDPTKIVVTAP
jgi:NitT/TauT family transport system substrate-binding protein